MRGLDSRFLDAMRVKLNHGRAMGNTAWDQRWKYGINPNALVSRLHQELDELVVALDGGDEDKILNEAADVANFAMFIADIHRPAP